MACCCRLSTSESSGGQTLLGPRKSFAAKSHEDGDGNFHASALRIVLIPTQQKKSTNSNDMDERYHVFVSSTYLDLMDAGGEVMQPLDRRRSIAIPSIAPRQLWTTTDGR